MRTCVLVVVAACLLAGVVCGQSSEMFGPKEPGKLSLGVNYGYQHRKLELSNNPGYNLQFPPGTLAGATVDVPVSVIEADAWHRSHAVFVRPTYTATDWLELYLNLGVDVIDDSIGIHKIHVGPTETTNAIGGAFESFHDQYFFNPAAGIGVKGRLLKVEPVAVHLEAEYIHHWLGDFWDEIWIDQPNARKMRLMLENARADALHLRLPISARFCIGENPITIYGGPRATWMHAEAHTRLQFEDAAFGKVNSSSDHLKLRQDNVLGGFLGVSYKVNNRVSVGLEGGLGDATTAFGGINIKF